MEWTNPQREREIMRWILPNMLPSKLRVLMSQNNEVTIIKTIMRFRDVLGHFTWNKFALQSKPVLVLYVRAWYFQNGVSKPNQAQSTLSIWRNCYEHKLESLYLAAVRPPHKTRSTSREHTTTDRCLFSPSAMTKVNRPYKSRDGVTTDRKHM